MTFRVLEEDGQFYVERKGWFFWVPVFGYSYCETWYSRSLKSKDDVIKAIKKAYNEPYSIQWITC